MPSTVIRSFRYDPEHRALHVQFVTGRLYIYYDVPADVAEAFRDAESKGRYFNFRIRDHFRFREIAGQTG